MWYIFNKDGVCMAMCNEMEPNQEDLKTRNEFSIVSKEKYDICTIRYDKKLEKIVPDEAKILKIAKASKDAELEKTCTVFITEKMIVNATGEELMYGYDAEDQSNLQSAMYAAEVTGSTDLKCYKPDGEKVFRTHSKEQLITVFKTLYSRVVEGQKFIASLRAALTEAKTEGEVAKIKWQKTA